MFVILASLAALAAAPATSAEPPKSDAPPADAAKVKTTKPGTNCVIASKRMVLGHEVTHLKCEDPKPAPASPLPPA